MSDDGQFCTSWVVHDGATWRCGRKRGHSGTHEAIGIEHPKDAMNYWMRWGSPAPYNERIEEVHE